MTVFEGFRRRLRGLPGDERGNVLIVAAMSLPVLIGAAGLGTDTAQWYLWKRELQKAVDAAALSGAYATAQGGNHAGSATAALNQNLSVATLVGTPSVALGSWPGGTNNAVTVSASVRRTLPFSSLFLEQAPTISATATAAVTTSGEHCMVGLDTTGTAVTVGGSALLRLGCGIASNSRDAEAMKIYGSAKVEASPLSAVGGITAAPENLIGDTIPRPYSVEQTDPLAGLTTPPDGPARVYDKNTAELQPGMYKDMQIGASHTMAPGVYTISQGTLKINAKHSLSGTGVIIVLKDGATIDINGGADISLTAPPSTQAQSWGLSSDFGGVLIYQDKSTASGASSKINGNATLHLGGAVYLPKQSIEINGNAAPSTQCLLLVAGKINISGNPIIPQSCPAGSRPPGSYGAKVVKLVA